MCIYVYIIIHFTYIHIDIYVCLPERFLYEHLLTSYLLLPIYIEGLFALLRHWGARVCCFACAAAYVCVYVWLPWSSTNVISAFASWLPFACILLYIWSCVFVVGHILFNTFAWMLLRGSLVVCTLHIQLVPAACCRALFTVTEFSWRFVFLFLRGTLY